MALIWAILSGPENSAEPVSRHKLEQKGQSHFVPRGTSLGSWSSTRWRTRTQQRGGSSPKPAGSKMATNTSAAYAARVRHPSLPTSVWTQTGFSPNSPKTLFSEATQQTSPCMSGHWYYVSWTGPVWNAQWRPNLSPFACNFVARNEVTTFA